MSNGCQLSVNINPGFAAECYHNFRLSIVLANNQTIPWLLSNFVNLTVKSDGFIHFPIIRFEEHLEIYSEIMEETAVIESADWLGFIKNAIQHGQYIVIYLDWINIPNSTFYRRKSMVHEALIYGYDDDAQKFQVIAFEVDGKTYGSTQIDFDLCLSEFERLRSEKSSVHKWFAYYGYPMSQIRLKEHTLHTMDMRKLYFALDRGRIKAGDAQKGVYAIGYCINSVISEYFLHSATTEVINQSEFALWNIMVHKLLLHKKLMIQRLQYMYQISPSTILAKVLKGYLRILEDMRLVRLMSYKYQNNSNDITQLQLIGNTFEKSYNNEKRYSTLLMENLIYDRLSIKSN